MSREISEILRACPSTEPASFYEFLRGLRDIPAKGDKEAWAELFDEVRAVENMGLIEVEYNGRLIESIMLTEAGVAKVKKL